MPRTLINVAHSFQDDGLDPKRNDFCLWISASPGLKGPEIFEYIRRHIKLNTFFNFF